MSEIDIDRLMDDEDDLALEAGQVGGRVKIAKNILLGQLAGFAHQLEELGDEYAMEGEGRGRGRGKREGEGEPRVDSLPELPDEKSGTGGWCIK